MNKEIDSQMPKWLFEQLQDNQAVLNLDKENKDLPLTSLIEEALIIATSFLKKKRPILVVKHNLYQAQRLYDRLLPLVGKSECALFGADESLRVEAIAASPELSAMQVETLSSLLENPNQIVVTCTAAYLRYLPKPSDFKMCSVHLKVDDTYTIDELKQRLRASGYQQTPHVDSPLTFASRGGIVDVYSINYEHPIRIEFFDTVIESIRFFDVVSQKTIEKMNEVKIVPASPVLFSKDEIEEIIKKAQEILDEENDDVLREQIAFDLEDIENNLFEKRLYPYRALLKDVYGIWDYMPNALVIYSDNEMIEESYKSMMEDTIAYIQEMHQEKKLLPKYTMWHDFNRLKGKEKRVHFEPFETNIAKIEEIHLPNEPLLTRIQIAQNDNKAVLVAQEKELEKIIHTCVENQIPYTLLSEDSDIHTGINIYMDDFMQGFYIVEKDVKIYSALELFEIHYHKGRYENKFQSAEVIRDYEDLIPGDYVVHAQHGVGQYIGIETRDINNSKRDFLKIVYRGNAELLVPLEQFRLVRKFVSREGIVPRLNKLGTNEWEKTKKRIQENVEDIAERLLNLYSARENNIGFAFSKDTELTKKFESNFLHHLTDDQSKAVEDIKKDMESAKPMDRLVCGDVGFGKTEVAIRASFKAVADGKQVAVLCPTTILSMQHFKTFCQRYEGFPVTIEVLNRFISTTKQKEILQKLKDGKIDILIGTHRILSKDIAYNDLGLLIVDEEQRFGVEHKEKIKEMKNTIDVLSLSATPIPRTLQMSLVGIRSLSQLDTPPLNRYSVQTYVVEKNEHLIVNAIQKELARDGQVFYLYNNIDEIYTVARKLQHALPDAKIGIVHGQMSRDDIEDIMIHFNEHKLDILVCTTIVENGIDIPNANTILIDNAQNFGLAQIYQIKGRVGRSDRVAYAYLLIPPRKQLSEIAQKRLQAVKEFAKLGSGYKIAMRDLTIRGAGDLLGPEQSGFIDTVGIDMYIEMLEEAIAIKKGEAVVEKEEKEHINLKDSGYIPEEFAPNDFDKISMYQKIDEIDTLDDLEIYKEEVIDQFGKLPIEVNTVFLKKALDLKVEEDHVQSYKEIRNNCELTFTEEFSQTVDGVKLFEDLSKLSKDISIKYKNNKITIVIPSNKNMLYLAIQSIDIMKEAVRDESR